ncbi:superoxide dismutase family protein [Dokdonia sinensis]|uniref:Superoxide dismutase [Cu-Zn] n=1 Tax=Dokdonia sinensis TaxID=2479847 RepID=A0A3M0G9T6_9FLAO|nr:superoxide dismutase family protein [Dokdonia sinensis]RMB61017.1 superoxide dismutase family protein [Dokdonia sinensis]
MKKIASIAFMSLAILATSCKKDKKEDNNAEDKVEATTSEDNSSNISEAAKEEKVTFKLSPKSGSKASGSVVFKENDGKVTFTAVIGGLAEGTHAIHIHESADCSSEDGKSTGGHWNPTGKPHGKWGDAGGYHKGDIGNFEADENGNGTITMTTDEWCIGCDDASKNVLGKAIIVHQGVDDFTSQPSGDAGARISCGGIIQ